jgi:hypothetical protein
VKTLLIILSIAAVAGPGCKTGSEEGQQFSSGTPIELLVPTTEGPERERPLNPETSEPESPKAVTIHVYGEVKHPGKVRSDEALTIEQAIEQAGGVTEFGSRRRVVVTQGSGRKILVSQKNFRTFLVNDEESIWVLRPEPY